MVTFMFFSAKIVSSRTSKSVGNDTEITRNYSLSQSVRFDWWVLYVPVLSVSFPSKEGFLSSSLSNLVSSTLGKQILKPTSSKLWTDVLLPTTNSLYTPFWLPYFFKIFWYHKAPEFTPACFPPCHPMALRTPPRHSSRALRLNQPSHAPKSEQETSWIGGFFGGGFLLKKSGYLKGHYRTFTNFALFCGFFFWEGRRCLFFTKIDVLFENHL